MNSMFFRLIIWNILNFRFIVYNSTPIVSDRDLFCSAFYLPTFKKLRVTTVTLSFPPAFIAASTKS